MCISFQDGDGRPRQDEEKRIQLRIKEQFQTDFSCTSLIYIYSIRIKNNEQEESETGKEDGTPKKRLTAAFHHLLPKKRKEKKVPSREHRKDEKEENQRKIDYDKGRQEKRINEKNKGRKEEKGEGKTRLLTQHKKLRLLVVVIVPRYGSVTFPGIHVIHSRHCLYLAT